MLKKSVNISISQDKIINEENFQYVMLEIISNVIEEKKNIHMKYHDLIKKVWISKKTLNKKTLIARYLLTRALRESDRAFNQAQTLAKQLCPSCKKKLSSYEDYSDSLH